MNPATQSLILNASPNPFEKKIWIRIASSDYEEGLLSLIDIYGHAIQRQNMQLKPGINEFEMEPENIPAGLYYLHYSTQITRIFIIIKLMKH